MRRWGLSCLWLLSLCVANTAHAQTFGIESHNTMMPAAGGMGGVSIARPQDLGSAINANPASLTQFHGTQFMFSGAWVEPTMNITQTGNIPAFGPALVEPYSAKSTAPGSPIGNIGVTQDFSALGLPATFGIGFVTVAGAAVDYRQVPESHATNSSLVIFEVPIALGVDVTDRLSLGAGLDLGIAYFDGPFVGLGGMTPDYALRGTAGANYLLTEHTTVGGYYQSEQAFRFDNAVVLNVGPIYEPRDVMMDLPQNLGMGVANNALMDGRLLLGLDVLYKLWNDTQMFGAIYDNQWVVQLGAQYSMGRYRLRAGYAWAENPIDNTPGGDIGGIVQPGELRAVRYTQAMLAVTSQHRLTAGIGVVDVLPGVDLDLMAGGMFRDEEQLGDFTLTSIESYWLGAGLTWRFGRGSVTPVAAPNSWNGGL